MKKNINKIFNFVSFLLFIISIVLSINIFNDNYYINITKDKIANFFTMTFNFKNFFVNIDNNNLVNTEVDYIYQDGKYITNTNYISAIYDGIIDEVSINKIVIIQNNNYYLVLEGEFDIFVKESDYIEKGSLLANYYEPFSLYFIKGNTKYNYEEYLSNSI